MPMPQSSRVLRIGAIAVVLIVVGLAYLFVQRDGATAGAQKPMQTYVSSEYGITFDYPVGYELSERDLEGSAERKRHAITLVRSEDLPLPENGEGPPSIAIVFVQNNLDGLTTREWVEGSADSNFKQSPDQGTAEVKVGGRDGLVYRWDGLYHGETTAVASSKWIYAFSVSFEAEDDEIVSDYHTILNSVAYSR